jgi:hypothetical protein
MVYIVFLWFLWTIFEKGISLLVLALVWTRRACGNFLRDRLFESIDEVLSCNYNKIIHYGGQRHQCYPCYILVYIILVFAEWHLVDFTTSVDPFVLISFVEEKNPVFSNATVQLSSVFTVQYVNPCVLYLVAFKLDEQWSSYICFLIVFILRIYYDMFCLK